MILTKSAAKNNRAQFRCTGGKNNGKWNSGRHFECFHGSFGPRHLKRIQFRGQMSEAKTGLKQSDFPYFSFAHVEKQWKWQLLNFRGIVFSYTRTFSYVIFFYFFLFLLSSRESMCESCLTVAYP